MRIVIVDDSPAIRDCFRWILATDSYELTIYPSGTPILNGDYSVPDVFIVDKQLSGVDGLDVCRFLKSQEETRDVPIIILSASPNIKMLARNAGADGILEKPFQAKALKEMVDKFVVDKVN